MAAISAALGLLVLLPPAATAKKGCPAGMVSVGDRFCIDAYEASLDVVSGSGKSVRRHSPFHTPKPGLRVAARSRRNVVPQAYVTQEQAAEACAAAGKRLCTDSEWVAACRGPAPTQYPYGDEHVAGRCNDAGVSPLRKLHGKDDTVETFGFDPMNDPRLNQMPGTLAKTGHFKRCRNAYGTHDMVGNLHEWTADPNGTFRGGYYLDNKQHGEGCSYTTTGHTVKYRDYSIGFRCCKGGEGDRVVAKQRASSNKKKPSLQKVHVVESGDTLSRIAARYDSSVEAICEANRIAASDPIRPGQELTVPVSR